MKFLISNFSAPRILVAFYCLLAFVSVFAQGGADPTFRASISNSSNQIYDVAVQSDNKILLVGDFNVVNGVARSKVARLNEDGTVDTGFVPPEMTDFVTAVAVQPDGKIMIGGSLRVVGSTRRFLIRLNSNGTIDNSFFNLTSLFNANVTFLRRIVIQPDGKILFADDDLSFNGRATNIYRLNADGTPDPTFIAPLFSGLWDATLMPDGKVVVAGSSTLRLGSNGAVDGTFPSLGSGDSVVQTEALPDGALIVGGDFTSLRGIAQGRISRILSDGSVDTGFNVGGSGANGRLYDVSAATDGYVYICGFFTSVNGVSRNTFARLSPDGSLDLSHNYSPAVSTAFVQKVAAMSDGRVVIAGRDVGGKDVSLTRLLADGSVDTSVRTVIGTAGSVRDIVRQTDGKYIVGGSFTTVNGFAVRQNIARLNADGSIDPTFSAPVFTVSNQVINKLAIQPDGKILVAGDWFPGSLRLNTDGSLDSTYVAPPILVGKDLDLLPGGQVLVNGYFRLNSNGSKDPTFNPSDQATTVLSISTAAVQSDGKFVVGGTFQTIGGVSRGRVARLNPTGSVDTTFNPSSGANGTVWELDVQADGKVIIAGDFTSVNGNTSRKYLARLNADGSLDTSFAPVIDAGLRSVKIQPDGKLLISGNLTTVNGIPRNRYARLNADGSLDQSFNFGSGANATVWRIGIQPDSKVLIAGDFWAAVGGPLIGVARLESVSAKTKFDYDGDGRADVSVFRPAENKWYILQSSNASVSEKVFAVAGDITAPADFDGDGKTDVAIFRPGSGDWWYSSSINNAQINFRWGENGDVPRPADFDGDGKADFIVYRPSNNVWYRYGTTGVTSIQQFGAAGDQPLTGDFDGDGKADNAIFRPSTGDFWYSGSVTGQFFAVHWGAAGDIPVTGDYDGDGKTDFAVFRPADGGWYILRSGDQSYTIVAFGLNGDRPVAADFDGDGKTDVAVWRPSTGIWYLLQTTAGFGAAQWGLPSDVATPAVFTP